MRTLELPDHVAEVAEAEAKRLGMTLEELTIKGLRSMIPTGRRATFSIIESNRAGFLNITPETLRQIEHEDDMRRSGLSD